VEEKVILMKRFIEDYQAIQTEHKMLAKEPNLPPDACRAGFGSRFC
jgi:hypothetical protein